MTGLARLMGPAALGLALLLTGYGPVVQAEPMVYGVTAEQLEYRFGNETDVAAWDAEGIVGSDEWKLAVLSEGEYATEHSGFETLEHQLTVRRLWTDFFDLKAGLRYDSPEGPDRGYAVVGLHGLAPQWIEVDADVFVSERGDLSARLEAEYELLVTNRLILRPSLEIDAAFADDEPIGIEAGFTGMELGLRLSYDVIYRALAPYAGLAYERRLGNTADRVEAAGGEVDGLFAVTGVRLMF